MKNLNYIVIFDVRTRTSSTCVKVSYVVRADSPFIALNKAKRFLSSEFIQPLVFGFNVHVE